MNLKKTKNDLMKQTDLSLHTWACMILILISISFTGCTQDTTPPPIDLSYLSDIIINVEEVNTTDAKIKLGNFFRDRGEKFTIHYQASNNPTWNTLELDSDNKVTLSSLESGTTYSFFIHASRSTGEWSSEIDTFFTKHIMPCRFQDKDIDKFNNVIYSYPGKKHMLAIEGIAQWNGKINLHLIQTNNKVAVDSITLPHQVMNDTLYFTIPQNYLDSDPYQYRTTANLIIEIGEKRYPIYNYSAFDNFMQDPKNHPLDKADLEVLGIYGTKPSIIRDEQEENEVGSYISLYGYFFANLNTTQAVTRANIEISQAGLVVASGEFAYAMVPHPNSALSIYKDIDLATYGKYPHLSKKATTNLFNDLAPGTYFVKLSFTMSDGTIQETNYYRIFI